MFLLNMGGHNYCSFSLSILAPSCFWDTRAHTYCTHTHTHSLKYTPAARSLVLLDHSRVRPMWIHMRQRQDDNDKGTLY